MATKRWLGGAANVLQVDIVTVALTWATGDTITLTINNVTFVLTIGTLVTTAQVATTLKQAFNGETLTDTTATYTPNNTGGAIALAQFAEITASVSGSVVTFTANTAGKPFTMTASEVTAGSGTAALTSVTSPTGKNWWNNAANWSGNTVPVDNDDLVFDQGNVDLLYGLTTAIQPASFRHDLSYTGKIGLDDINEDGGTDATRYPEYRTTHLTFDDNSVTASYIFGRGEGQGSSRIRIDFGAGRADVLTNATSASRANQGLPALTLKGTHASNAFVFQGGDVGLAFDKGDTTVAASVRIGTDGASNARIYLGSDLTLTASVQSGGNCISYCSCTTHTQHGGEFTQFAGAPASVFVWGGTYHSQSASTISTACEVGSSGTFNRSRDNRAMTITPRVELHKGARFLDPNSSLTLTAGYKTNGCKLSDCEIDVGNNRVFTVA